MEQYKNKAWLEQKYVIEKMGIYQIAELTGCPPRTIHSWLVKFNIPRRQQGVITHSESSKEKIRLSLIGTSRAKGISWSDESKEKRKEQFKGKFNPNWKGGITLSVRLFRKSKQYQEWRREILNRDNSKCQVCGIESNEVHHIFSVKDYPDLRLDIKNGQTLCNVHHKEKHKKGRPRK